MCECVCVCVACVLHVGGYACVRARMLWTCGGRTSQGFCPIRRQLSWLVLVEWARRWLEKFWMLHPLSQGFDLFDIVDPVQTHRSGIRDQACFSECHSVMRARCWIKKSPCDRQSTVRASPHKLLTGLDSTQTPLGSAAAARWGRRTHSTTRCRKDSDPDHGQAPRRCPRSPPNHLRREPVKL